MTQTAEAPTMTADELVAITVAGAQALQEADIYGRMDVRPAKVLEPTPYCGHEIRIVVDPQKSDAFKYRGASAAVDKAKTDGHEAVETVSTGSHGVANSMAAARVGMRSVVHAPGTLTARKETRLVEAGAEVVKDGNFGDSKARAEMGKNGVFIHPFANQEVRNGQATLGLELVRYLEWMGLTGFDGDVIIPVAVAGGSHILGIAGPVAIAKQEGRLGPGVRVVAVRPETSNVDALSISEDDRDHTNQQVLEDARYVAETQYVSDAQIGEALQHLTERGVENVESAGAVATAYALVQARYMPFSHGNHSRKMTFLPVVSGCNGSPEANAPFLEAYANANAPAPPATAGRLALLTNVLRPQSKETGTISYSGLRVGHAPSRLAQS